MTEKEGDKKREVEGEGGRVFNDCVEATPKLPPTLLSMSIFFKDYFGHKVCDIQTTITQRGILI